MQAYLSGQEVPSLYITYYKPASQADQHVSVLARFLESALHETLSHPALSVPKVGGLAGGLGSHVAQVAPPSGQAMFLEEEVEEWLEAKGLQTLHASSHKVIYTCNIIAMRVDLPLSWWVLGWAGTAWQGRFLAHA